MPPAGDIASYRLEWPNHLPKPHAALHIAHPLQRLLPVGEAPDIFCGGLESGAELRTDLPPRAVDFRLADTKARAGDAIELAAIAKQCGIALLSYIAHDLRGCLFNSREIDCASVRQSLEHGSIAFAGDEFHSFISFTSRSCSADTRQCRWR